MTRVDYGEPEHRILYLPIYEPGAYWARARANKRGLRLALERVGPVREWDYLAHAPRSAVRSAFAAHLNDFQPTVVLTQLQGADVLTAADIRALRAEHPRTRWANWNGDYWPEHLTAPDMRDLAAQFDVQLVVNGAALPEYAAAGVNAAYWPFGFEPVDDPLPKAPAHDVVYLGNNYSDSRAALYAALRALDADVGVYGSGWPRSEGETTYDFAAGAALYVNAKLAISDAQWPDATGYLSNRPFEALAAGVLVLQQRVAGIEDLLGLKDGTHWVLYESPDELPALVKTWLGRGKAKQRNQIAAAGKRHVRRWHSWDQRVRDLFEKLLP